MAKRKVRLVVDMPGMTYGRWNLRRGDEIELEAHQAQDLVAQGFAEDVKPKRRAKK